MLLRANSRKFWVALGIHFHTFSSSQFCYMAVKFGLLKQGKLIAGIKHQDRPAAWCMQFLYQISFFLVGWVLFL